MQDIHTIQRRIKGIDSISKISRAMEMIATSKMRNTQQRDIAGRPYAEKIQEVISALAAVTSGEKIHPLLEKRVINNIAIVHITPDRGLCGGLVANINREVGRFSRRRRGNVSFVCVGRKGLDYMRLTRRNVIAEFTGLGDKPSFIDTLPISRIIIDEYSEGIIDAAYLAYTRFISTIHQEPVIQPLLPITLAEIPDTKDFIHEYEPDPRSVLGELLSRFIEAEVYHAILESIASEQSARTVAMKNAMENASALTHELTLQYNKARQESITEELLDITGGVEAMKD